METRCNPTKLHGPLKKLGFHDFLHVDNVGFSGGILVASKEDNIKVSLICCGDQYIQLQAHNKNGQKWVFTVVYTSPYEGKRRLLWESLNNIATANNNNPWLMAGDFNDIAFANDKKGGGLASAKRCGIFRDNMDKCNLLERTDLSWGLRIYERLDRSIGNEEWRLMFTDAQVKVLTRVDFSDHHPIMIALAGNNYERIPKLFRFESAWVVENNYVDRLKGYWNINDSLIKNLKRIEEDAVEWKRCSVQHVNKVKRGIMARLQGIQRGIQNNKNTSGLLRLEEKLQRELNMILRQEELMWFQRSCAQCWTCWKNTTASFPNLAEGDINNLNIKISKEEVKKALFDMKPWKAPGPDGFPAGFYQKSWGVVGDSVCNFISRLWDFPSEIANVNKTDICLIPKTDNPSMVAQFRPISLCNTIYKVLSKIVVRRLKKHMDNLISPYQTGFVPGRQIHKNIIIAKEAMHTMENMKGKKGAFAIKVD
ncbi:uncharacterized protein LOC131626710 [Vicia villosa]|uniref:uncharacterized protein LOC131626710 n=1 Tax=Vicia villosa TaxID=3911 RepID=UPI00273B4A44|nr:uncharacterized protein LOC131626710 [Vicia villosa]